MAEQRASQPAQDSPADDLEGDGLEIWCLLDEAGHTATADDIQQLADYLGRWHPSALHYVERRCGVHEPFADDIRKRFDDTSQLLRALCQDGRDDGIPQQSSSPDAPAARNDSPPEDPAPTPAISLQDDGGVWRSARGILRDEIHPDSHQAYIQTIDAGTDPESGELVLVCPDDMHRMELSERYLDLIESAVNEAAGEDVTIRCESGFDVDITKPHDEEAA